MQLPTANPGTDGNCPQITAFECKMRSDWETPQYGAVNLACFASLSWDGLGKEVLSI